MSDVVGTSVDNEPFGLLENSKISNNAQEQEVNDLFEFLKLEHNKYVQYKIIYDTLEECIEESGDMDKNLKIKVRDILLSGNVAQAITLDDEMSEAGNVTLLGSSDINNLELNYTERNQLQECLKLKLSQKFKDINNEFYKLTNKDISAAKINHEALPLQISHDDKILVDYKHKLILEQEQYVKNLLNLLEVLKEISNLRLKKLPQVMEQKIKECQVEENMNHLKSLLTQEKVRVDVFMETSNSLKAYKELIKDIKEQQQTCRKEIEDLNQLKEKYNSVSCKQYDDILKSYIQYKSTLEKKKILYSCYKS